MCERRLSARGLGLTLAAIVLAAPGAPPVVGAHAERTTTTVSVSGCVLGDFCVTPSFSLDTAGLVLSGQVTASDTVTVTMRNDTGGAIDLDSGTLAAAVLVF